ncbi:MAG: hypothetical protein H0T60_02200 [Acidobacteria bacterium]|nr:hypothetical protein [Acidobacteriota bacterium]
MLNEPQTFRRRFRRAIKTKKALLVGCVLLLLAGGVTVATFRALALQEPAEPGTIAWTAQEARAQDITDISSTVFPMYTSVNGLDEATSRYTVVVAQASDRHTHLIDAYSFMTWYKFRVVETISSKPLLCTDCPATSPPAEMLPVATNEILVPTAGGEFVYDGVTCRTSERELPAFNISANYLLFIDLDAANRVGATSIGPAGIFHINNDQLIPVGTSTAISDDIAARYNNSLSQLRAGLSGTPRSGVRA